MPDPLHLHAEQQQTAEVAADTEVVEVAHRPPRERDVLRLYPHMSITTTPGVDGLNYPSKTRRQSRQLLNEARAAGNELVGTIV